MEMLHEPLKHFGFGDSWGRYHLVRGSQNFAGTVFNGTVGLSVPLGYKLCP